MTTVTRGGSNYRNGGHTANKGEGTQQSVDEFQCWRMRCMMRAWVVLLSASHRCCDLTQRASVSMRKCADLLNLKFVYMVHLHVPLCPMDPPMIAAISITCFALRIQVQVRVILALLRVGGAYSHTYIGIFLLRVLYSVVLTYFCNL